MGQYPQNANFIRDRKLGILSTIFQPSISAQQTTLENPDAWLLDWARGKRTVSGENVNHKTALSLSAYLAAIRAISEDIAKLPFKVFFKKNNARVLAEGDPVLRLINLRPNNEMTAMAFRETLTHHALGWGNGYAEIQRTKGGVPFALHPIHPSRVQLKRKHKDVDEDEPLFYEVTQEITQRGRRSFEKSVIIFEPEDMLHIHGLGSDGLSGYSILQLAAESLGIGIAAQKYGASFFGNGANVGLIVSHPKLLSPKARKNLEGSLNRKHRTASSANRLEIFEEGMKVERLGIPPNEAQFLETRMFEVEEIARWFRIPPHKIGHLQRSTFNNIESQNIEYIQDSLSSWAVRWEQEVDNKLLQNRDTNLFSKHILAALLRGDQKSRALFYKTIFQMGAFSPNDIRKMEDLNPIDSESADQYYMQLNMTTIDNINEMAEEDGNSTESNPRFREDEDEKAFNQAIDEHRPILLSFSERMVRKEQNAYAKAYNKHENNHLELAKWAAKFYENHEKHIVESFQPSAQMLGFEDNMQEFALKMSSMSYSDIDANPSAPFFMDKGYSKQFCDKLINDIKQSYIERRNDAII